MALKTCTECGRQVSTKAKRCPGCGNPCPTRTEGQRLIVVGLVLVGLFFMTPILAGLNKILKPVMENHIKNFIEVAKSR